eukprot:g309.t1
MAQLRTFARRAKARAPEAAAGPPSNDAITAPQLRVIDENGDMLGVVDRLVALDRAKGLGLDLVAVAPGQDPPVCRIMDLARHNYEQNKTRRAKKKEARATAQKTGTKEVVVKSKIDGRDMERNVQKAAGFLEDGHQVKFTIQLLRVHPRSGHQSMEERDERVSALLDILSEQLEDVLGGDRPDVSRKGNRITATLKKK